MNRLKLVIFDLDDTLCDTSASPDVTQEDSENIKLFPGVTELIEEIRARDIFVAVVSTGDTERQERKVEILGLRALVDVFYVCAIPEDKLSLFRQCLREFAVQPEETVVVGDRIDREILAGNAAHCVTVRVLQGKHSNMVPTSQFEQADYTIEDIAALRRWFGPWLLSGQMPAKSLRRGEGRSGMGGRN